MLMNENFKEWFGKSKIVDQEGKPLVVYHGTTAVFDTFSSLKKGSNTAQSNTVHGFFFAADRSVVELFAHQNNQGGEVVIMDVYLSIKKPMDMRQASFFNLKKQAVDLVEFISGGEKKLSEKSALAWLNRNIDIPDWLEMTDYIDTEDFYKFLVSRGYDGIISNFGGGHAEYVAFRPNQIKSASRNNGEFSPISSNIYL